MKITKRGIIPEEKIWYGKCLICNSEAEATRKELLTLSRNQHCVTDTCIAVDCTVCSKHEGMIFYPFKKYMDTLDAR
jgi:hypothetical protein